MEKDTVFISLREYNELRDFKKNIEDGKILESYEKHMGNLADEIYRLRSQLKKKDEEYKKRSEQKEITLEDVKNMNWLELWKWKRR